MNTETILGLVWTALNSPAGITVVAGIFLWLLNRLYAAKPGWFKYEGAIITGIKFAEKEIPDGTPNKGLSRLDAALRYVLKIHEEASGKRATPKLAAEIKEGIQITHDKLEAAGTLKARSGQAES